MINKALLYKFFEGKTSITEEIVIRNWIEENKENESSFFQERKLYDTILLNKKTIANIRFKGKHTKPLYLSSFINVAAMLLFLTTIGLLLNKHFVEKHSSTQLNTIIVPPGQRMNIILADNSSIWLNANTTFRYPSNFSKKQREVYLDGEGYFDVSANDKSPFIVNTTQGEIKVTGTKFNISAYTKYSKFETSLFSGKVGVALNNNPDKIINIQPAQRATVQNGKLEITKIDDYDEFLWRKGLIAFNNKQLDEILVVLEQYFDIKIQIDATTLPKNTYTGKFRQTDGIDYALRVLQKSIHFKYERDDEQQAIYIKNT